jgi:hypothetical protein
MPRVRLRIHPTGHVEMEIDGMDEGCHALVEETASGVGVILERRLLPPGPGHAGVTAGRVGRQVEGSALRLGGTPPTV